MAILRTLTLILNDDGKVRSARGEHVELDANGRDQPFGTKRLSGDDLQTALPDHAALLASIAALTAERDALQAQVDVHDAEKTAMQAQIDALNPPTVSLTDAIKSECERRIYAIADSNTQMNMVAAAATHLLDEAGTAALTLAVQWVGAMRAAASGLIAAADQTYANDAHWPPCPADVVALANTF